MPDQRTVLEGHHEENNHQYRYLVPQEITPDDANTRGDPKV